MKKNKKKFEKEGKRQRLQMTKNNLSNGSQQKQNTLQHSGITRVKAAHCAEVNVLSVSCWANLNQSLQRNIGVFCC